MVIDKAVGLLMRIYRRSPLYPRYGAMLAKVLSVVTRSRSAKLVERDINGIKFELDLSQIIDASLYYSGTFEAVAEQLIAGSLHEGMTAIDIGANFGYHTLAMARSVGPTGRILAIEPTAWAYAKLLRNASLNKVSNIEFIQVGLSDSEEGEQEIAFQSSYRLDGQSATRQEKVLITTLDSVIEKLGVSAVHFIKLDVDGYEGKVLRGARKLLKQHRPIVFFEISPSAMAKNGDSAQALLGLLQELAYAFRTESGVPINDVVLHCSHIADGYSENLVAVPA